MLKPSTTQLLRPGVIPLRRQTLGGWIAIGLLMLATAQSVVGQSHRIRFDHLSISEGLSQASGNAIIQDSRGFMWFGTEDGLNRFDGYEIEVFRHDPDDPTSLADNYVTGLFEDGQKRLWIFFNQPGLISIFDLETERFQRLQHDPDDPASLPLSFVNSGDKTNDGFSWLGSPRNGVTRIQLKTLSLASVRHDPEDPSSLADDRIAGILTSRAGELWIATQSALHRRLTPSEGPPEGDSERFERFSLDDPPTEPGSRRFNNLIEDSDGMLWLGSRGGGLYRFAPSNGQVQIFLDQGSEGSARPIAETGDGTLWVATHEALVRFDRQTFEIRSYRQDPEDPHSLGSDRVRDFLEDSQGTVWIGTEGGGLNRYDPDLDAFIVYRHQPADPGSLSNDFVRALYEDRSGILWIGTFGAGIDRFSRDKHKFRLYRHDPADPETLDGNTIFPVYEDSDGILWVGTLGGGLNRFSQDRRRVVAHHLESLEFSRPSCLFEDSEKRFWIGTFGSGLLLFDRDSGKVIRRLSHDPDDETSLPSNSVNSVFEDSQGRLWVAAGGWSLFDPESGLFNVYLRDRRAGGSPLNGVRIIHEDHHGELWITNSQGLSRYDEQSESFTQFSADPRDPHSLSHPNIMGLYETPDGHFWVTTYGGGLNRFDPKTGRSEVITTKNGLPSDALYGILPDDQGNLWISSNGGLVRLDPSTMAITTYDVDDGLQSNEFNDRSYFRSRTGELFFGGVNGLNSFFPDQLKSSDYQPPVVITSLIKSGLRQKLDLSADDAELVVSYKENFFSFEFASLDYSTPEKNLYAYKLEGFDDDWIQAGSRRFAGYTNLDGGRYVFRVRGTNSDGVWSEKDASIAVRVTTPPWKTWWAYCLYALALVAAVLAYVRHKTAVHREEVRRQRKETERLRQIDRMKDELLANTSHELRTPLNGIIGITQSLLDGATGKLSQTTRSNLAMVVSSGRRLAHLVDDILDFSKLRQHQIELRRSAVKLRAVVDDVLALSQPLLAGKDLELLNEVPKDLPLIDADSNRLQQIFHNVVGNGIKFTKAGRVTVSAQSRDDQVVITVSDTGIGIPADQIDRVFQSFAQADGSTARTYGGTGLGLTITRRLVELHGGNIRVESVEGEGTRVIFSLPCCVESEDGAEETGHFDDERAMPEPVLAQIRDLESVELLPFDGLEGSPDNGGFGPGHGGTGNGNRHGHGPDSRHANRHSVGAGVMIVDDEPINLQVMRNILSLEGFAISQAHDGPQCLAQLDGGETPNIILLDVMMPGMTGFEVTREIRNRYSANDLPILLVTAKNQVSDLEKGLASGANDYLTKPFSRNELLARMRTHLSLARAHTMEAENQRKTEELEQARMIQLSLLPKSPPDLPYLDIAVHMETATEVGGDYYDFFTQDDGALYVVTGDATGHGISAGMVVSMTKSALKALDVQSPHLLLHQLNQVLRAVKLERMQMALNVTYLTDTEIAISSAAMPPSYLYRPGRGVEEILLPGLPLGAMQQAVYTLKVLEFHRDDVLLQISDGLPERIGANDDMLGYDAIAECLEANGNRPAQEILDALLELHREWAGTRPPSDDITALVLKRR